MTKSISVRPVIMKLLKDKFEGFAFWKRIETQLAMLCADLVEPISDTKKRKFVEQLKGIKNYLVEEQIGKDDLEFIDEEIERYEQTRTMSLYVEEEDNMDPTIVDMYARLGMGTEGVIGIHQSFNYTQLKRLTNGVFDKTGLIKFYISREKTMYGKIIAEIYEHPQKIPIATLIQKKKKKGDEPEDLKKRIALFGEKIDTRSFHKIKEINVPFYVYRFITENNIEYVLISPRRHEIGDYVVTGVTTQCDDYRMLTDSAKLPTKLPYVFAQNVKNRIIKFKDHDEFLGRIKYLKINKKDTFDFPFTIKKGNRAWVLLQPTWFKWLVWAWLTHENKGLFNNYPLHLMIIGPKMSGKSLLLNSLHARSKETRSVFSGSSSTLKHLVPSFKYNPARLGYLAESNRFAFCDEFLRCLISTRTTKEGSQREESVAIMNDLLEHQKREAGSGVSRVNVNMTSRIVATTNPIRGINNVEDLINILDESFLSRWLIYYQTDDHVQLIRKSRDSSLQKYKFTIQLNDWVSLLDYLQQFSAEYDMEKVKEVHMSIPKVLSETLKSHYDARHMHHLECLIDGIVKTRCLLENDMSFIANDEDYKILKEVWMAIIRSWINPDSVRGMDVKDRIFYLPENCQYLYWKINEQKRPVSKVEAEEIGMRAMSKREYTEALIILLDMGVLVRAYGNVKPHYMGEIKHEDKLRFGSRKKDEKVV